MGMFIFFSRIKKSISDNRDTTNAKHNSKNAHNKPVRY